MRWCTCGAQTSVPAELEVISFGESAVADEGAGDAGEGEKVLGLAFVAAVESSAAGEPGRWVGRAVRCSLWGESCSARPPAEPDMTVSLSSGSPVTTA